MRVRVHGQDLAGRGDEFDLAKGVDGQAVGAHEPADAAAEHEPADPHVARVARGDAEPVRCERRRDVAPVRARPDVDDAVGADLDRGEVGQVDDDAPVTGSDPCPPERTVNATPAATADRTARPTSEADPGRTTASGVPWPAKTCAPASYSVEPGACTRPGIRSLSSLTNDMGVSLAAASDIRHPAGVAGRGPAASPTRRSGGPRRRR
ncbi:hypothetical protein GCM10025870_17400 [Agromyces marinus]|uniref:Uncharacterized protein n=1 Tax=Agromyces marinus TaxID=1389020 RepID=A0ABM8H1K4_9MICO|nr:hypothetical protein GCM10025870_17400 [Agromyces marinus]